MGHAFRKEHSIVPGLRPARIVTCASTAELVDAAARCLHRLMAKYRRDRWWFLGGAKGNGRDIEFELWTLWGGAVAIEGKAEVSCVLRARVIQSRPIGIDVNFYAGEPRDLALVGLAQPEDRIVAISVELAGERSRRRRWPHLLRSVQEHLQKGVPRRFMSKNEVRNVWLEALREGLSGENEGTWWWVDPKNTPLSATRFVLFLYLFQGEVVELSPDDQAWAFLREFANRGRRTELEDGVLWDAISKMKEHFSLPRDWKGLGLYLHRICFDIERSNQRRGESILDRFGLSPRTAYRYMSQGVLPPIRLKDLGRVERMEDLPPKISNFIRAAKERVDKRTHRRAAIQYYVESRGLSREAARKRVYRRLRSGESPEKILQDAAGDRRRRPGGAQDNQSWACWLPTT